MVKELRQITTEEEISEIHFTGIARNIEASSVLVKGFNVLEQSYADGAMSKNTLLEKYIGREVIVRNQDTGEAMQIRLLSAVDGLIGERPDTKEIIIDPAGELILPPMPKGLLEKPMLVWQMAPGELDQHISVSYIVQGIEWRTNYIVEIQGTALFLTGWMEIRNNTGIDYENPAIKLIAGEVYRQPKTIDFSFEPKIHESSMSSSQFEQADFEDHPSYKLDRPISLLDGQTKQIKFLEAHIESFRTIYEVDNWSERARVKIEYDNKKSNGLGISLPRGAVKIFRHDKNKELEFVGENEVESSMEEDIVSVLVGEAFAISCRSHEKKRWLQEGVEYVTYGYDLMNNKQENVRIHISHTIHEPIWIMESSTHDYEIKNAGHVKFIVRTAAKKATAVEFTYRVDKR
ncbi:hypothetical protein B0H99_105137 [Planomicrobium soli]|uniref:DUF4139 domain-containing protein n=2 Tax=Planomicrobium soli TaxID=1176648 RepID=A0A2P8H2D1_9BACL|nr:hypothetical protein B0H99_105137 [Planomicrobium soli]